MEKQTPKMNILNEKTLIPLSLCASIAAVAYSFSQVYAHVDTNTGQIEKIIAKEFDVNRRLYNQINELRDKLSDVSGHVREVNGKLDVILYRVPAKQEPDPLRKKR